MSKEPEFIEPSEDDDIDLETVQEEMTEELGNLMDWNSRMQKSALRSARRLLRTADNYDALADRCRDLATVMVATAQQLSTQASNLIIAEFDVEVVEATEEEEDGE